MDLIPTDLKQIAPSVSCTCRSIGIFLFVNVIYSLILFPLTPIQFFLPFLLSLKLLLILLKAISIPFSHDPPCSRICACCPRLTLPHNHNKTRRPLSGSILELCLIIGTASSTLSSPPSISSVSTVFGTGPSLTDFKRSSFELFTIQAIYRRVGLGTVLHLHKAESLRSASVVVLYNLDGFDLTETLKSLLQILLSDLVR